MNKEKLKIVKNKILDTKRFVYDEFCINKGAPVFSETAILFPNPESSDVKYCVAGWTVALFVKKREEFLGVGIYGKAKEILDLTVKQAKFLFRGYAYDHFPEINLSLQGNYKEAISRIDHLLGLP